MRHPLRAALAALATVGLLATGVSASAVPGDETRVSLSDPSGDVLGTSGAAQKADVDVSRVTYTLTHGRFGSSTPSWQARFVYVFPGRSMTTAGVTYQAVTWFSVSGRSFKTVSTTGSGLRLLEQVGTRWVERPVGAHTTTNGGGEMSVTMRAITSGNATAYSKVRSVVYRYSVSPGGKRTQAYDPATRHALLPFT
ncbi:hypothetical protein GCM10027425_03720 [Alteromonas gracilis]